MPLDGTVPTSKIEVKTPLTHVSVGTKDNENNQVEAATQNAPLKAKVAGGNTQDTEPSLKWRGKSIVMDYGFSGSYPLDSRSNECLVCKKDFISTRNCTCILIRNLSEIGAFDVKDAVGWFTCQKYMVTYQQLVKGVRRD